MPKKFCVYILASKRNGTLYTGMTSNLSKRIAEHREHMIKGFTDKYNVTMLVFVEFYDNFEAAMLREKRIKTWKRDWKLRLIEENNPEWKDLAEDVFVML